VGLGVVGVDLGVHQGLDLVRVQVAAHHHAQVVGDEVGHVVVVAHVGVLLEQRRVVRVFNVFFDRHQALFAGLLQDVVEQRQQLHEAGLGVLASLEAHANARHRGLDHVHLVVGQKGPQCSAKDGGQFEGQRLQDDAHVAAVRDVHAKNARQHEHPTDDDKHGVPVPEPSDPKRGDMPLGFTPSDALIVQGLLHLTPGKRTVPHAHFKLSAG
jgi:hypothetical protein